MMRRDSRFGVLALLLAIGLGLNGMSCGQAILSAPAGSTIAIVVNPPFIAANGDTAVVSVLVIEPAGTPVPDGTVVQFFSTLGRIQEQAKTNDGVARVNFISDSRSGTAKITVYSGPVTTNADVTVGALRPSRVISGLIDARIDLSSGASIARFKVTVQDVNGNGVASVPVHFSVIDDPGVDRVLEPDVVTNNSGEAQSRVQTQRTTPGTIRIRAEVLSATAISAEFTISVVE
jgi:hypothetical protein